jgi:hypothetical protein
MAKPSARDLWRINIGLSASGVAFPTCWVVAESEVQRVNKMEIFFKNGISLIEEL